MTRMKHFRVTFTALLTALLLMLGAMVGVGAAGAKASAAEDPEPVIAAPGWYVVGNGAGDLKDCSWQEYRAAFKLTSETEDPTQYEGEFVTGEMLLYAGDQFKVLYQNGTWEVPDDSKWGVDVCAGFGNILDNTDDAFSDGGLGNIYCNISGYYTFTLNATAGATPEEALLVLSFDRSPKEVPPLTLYNMYVVGTIASVETCGWPDAIIADGKTVQDTCIKMTPGEGKTWTATNVVLATTDEFKLFNTITGTYYPGGFDNNLKVEVAGTYTISWVEGSQDVTVTLNA